VLLRELRAAPLALRGDRNDLDIHPADRAKRLHVEVRRESRADYPDPDLLHRACLLSQLSVSCTFMICSATIHR
jgi:hypothetical protein